MNLNGLNRGYLAHHILKQSGTLEIIGTPETKCRGQKYSGAGSLRDYLAMTYFFTQSLIARYLIPAFPMLHSLKPNMSVQGLEP